jgi:hypothetical protein
MSDTSSADIEAIEPRRITVDDLYLDLACEDTAAAVDRLRALPTDIMFGESAGALIESAAHLRFVAHQHARPGGPAQLRMLELADALVVQAADLRRAADSAAIAIRETAGRRHSGA